MSLTKRRTEKIKDSKKLCPLEQGILDHIERCLWFLFRERDIFKKGFCVAIIFFVVFNIYFYTKSSLLISSILCIPILIAFYLWIKTISKLLLIGLMVVFFIFFHSIIYSEHNYSYILSEIVKNSANRIIGPEVIKNKEINPYYIFPPIEELSLRIKEDLFFNKEPFLVTRVSIRLIEDNVYKVRPIYVVFVKNIGNQSVKPISMDWNIYSKECRSTITDPNGWLKSIGKEPITYPVLFPGDYFFFKYGPDPAAGYMDQITLSIDVHFKNLTTGKEQSVKTKGNILYDGKDRSYYKII